MRCRLQRPRRHLGHRCLSRRRRGKFRHQYALPANYPTQGQSDRVELLSTEGTTIIDDINAEALSAFAPNAGEKGQIRYADKLTELLPGTSGHGGRCPRCRWSEGANVESNAGVERVVRVIAADRAARLGSAKRHRTPSHALGDVRPGTPSRSASH